ncbi:hypothetical protein ATCC90586_005899 [Pythium insidiosum]|nr:hypothetical protein ATCC90586_005899 [Pythium insidiosum]
MLDLVGAVWMRLRRRLEDSGAGAGADADGSLSDAALMDDEATAALDAQHLVVLNVCGWLSVSLYSLLALAILWKTAQHFRHRSTPRKRVFHVLLLASVVLNLPDPVGWIVWPMTESWIYTYPLRIYSLILQSICKSIISIAWSEVVSAGQSYERRRASHVVMAFNGMLLLWGVSVPLLLARYPNDVYGQSDFMQSKLRKVFTYTGVGIIFIYGLLLTYQGMRLRRRLMLAKGTVPIGSVEKSLSQLMLTVYVIVFSDVMRLGSLLAYELKVDMPMTTFLVCNNLIPNIFPTICMLYLMRRFTRRDAARSTDKRAPSSCSQPGANVWARRGTLSMDATLSRFMTDDRDSDLHNTPVLGGGGGGGTDAYKFALRSASHIASIDRVDLLDSDSMRSMHHHLRTGGRSDAPMVDSKGSRQGTLTPTSHWIRE